MLLSQNVAKVKPSITLAVSAKAKAMKDEGIDVIALSAGEPDFNTPSHICDAGIAAINAGFTRYTPASGTLELKKAICDKFRNDNVLDYKTSQIIVNCGAKHSVFLTVFVLTGEGDEVIVPSPYWVSYYDMVKLAGGNPVVIEGKSDNNLKITPEQLKNAITDRTKLLILNSPSNPTGMVYSENELKALADVIVESGIHVLSDEIYEKLIYDGKKHISIASFSDEIYNKTITINGVSKSYSMTGWRIGYAAGPEEIIKAMSTVQSQETSNPCSISQKAALAALTGSHDFLETWVSEFSERRLYIIDRLNSLDGVTCKKPEGAFYVFPDVSAFYGRSYNDKVIGDSVAFCEYMLNEQHIALVPGAGFGADAHVRISYAVSMENIEKSIDRFEKGLQILK
ncbi:pyridoxal phosphate-dependent aminotransferase [Candidatus Latescibacterota bacterium]